MTMLKQIAIAVTEKGAIGAKGELLFRCGLDMMHFANLTHRTVMIAGSATAKEMMGQAVTLSANRPMVVIGSSTVLPNFKSREWLFYADNLRDAVELAAELAEDMCLSGWTIIGGRQVYQSWIVSNIGINRAYVLEAHFEPDCEVERQVVVLESAELIKHIHTKMAHPQQMSTRRSLMLTLNDEFVRKDVTFHWLHCAQTLNPQVVKENANALQIQTSAGVLTVQKGDITGYLSQRDRNAVQILTAAGQTHEIRFASNGAQSIASLTHTLDKIIN